MNLTLHLTHNCNLRCRYCYAGAKERRDMSSDVMRRAVDLALAESQGAMTISFFGGEPLLRKDLMREGIAYASERAREKGTTVAFQVSTNGTLVDDDFLDFAAETGMVLSLSIDGVAPAHDCHRVFPDGSGSFEVIAGKLPGILERLPYTPILMVVTPETAKYLPKSVAYFLDMGARFVVPTLNYGADWDARAMGVLARAYRRMARDYVRRTRRGQKFFLSALDNKIASRARGPCSEREKCSAGKWDFSVAPSGRIYPCVQFVKEDRGGDYVIGDVLKGFDAKRRAAVHAESRREKQHCPDCAINERCNNWCACLNWQTTGSMYEVSPVLCTHEKMLVEIADQAAEQLYRRRNKQFIHKQYNEAYPVLSFIEDEMAKAEEENAR